MVGIFNTFREQGSAASGGLCDLVDAANAEVTSSAQWTSADNHQVEPFETPEDGTSTPNADYNAFSTAASDCSSYVAATAADLEWKEGFALAASYLIDDSSTSGTIASTGENGNDRVNMYGELSGTLEEEVWRITVSGGMQASDVAIALFVNEGDDGRTFRAALMNPEYSNFGGAVSCDSNDLCTYDYYLAKGYTNDPDIDVCGVD